MKILGISRTTLYLYMKSGKLTGTKLENGYYDYDDKTVFKLMKKDNRMNVIYGRVSTYKQKKDLKTQIESIQKYCDNKKIKIDKIYSDISSGLDLDRKDFSQLIDDVINYRIKYIYISYKDRLTRLSYRTIKELFSKYGVEIMPTSNKSCNTNDNEIFEELISLMHIFSTTMYSKRRKNKINIYKQDIENYIS